MNTIWKVALLVVLSLLILGNAWMYLNPQKTDTTSTTSAPLTAQKYVENTGTILPKGNNTPPTETKPANVEIESPSVTDTSSEVKPSQEATTPPPAPATTPPPADNHQHSTPLVSNLERLFIDYQLVNVNHIDPTIMVDLRYASANNFMGENVYGDIKDAYLQREVALMLSKAQEYLKEMKPDLTLLLLDGARPRQVQQKMWDLVKGTDAHKYVAAPSYGSIHNYGAAVDVSIAHIDGTELDMGTAYDHFGELAQPRHERKYTQMGELNSHQLANRILLRQVMKKAGFRNIMSEWWHFEACNIHTAKKKYKLIK